MRASSTEPEDNKISPISSLPQDKELLSSGLEKQTCRQRT
jgi:hypothetical protein